MDWTDFLRKFTSWQSLPKSKMLLKQLLLGELGDKSDNPSINHMYSLQMFMLGSHYVASFGFRQSCFMLLCYMEKVNGLLEVYIKTSSYVKRHESRLDLKHQQAKPIIFKTPQGAKVSGHFNRNNSGKTLPPSNSPFNPNFFATQTKWHTFMWTAVQSSYTFCSTVWFG